MKEQVRPRYVRGKKTLKHISKWEETLTALMNPEGKPEALDGILVLDVSYANFAGIIAASLLAELGAETIKVEPPKGDPARFMSPYGLTVGDVGVPFLMEGRNKYYITLDLKDEKGRENFKKLATKADILIETFTPGFMDQLGIGYRQLSKINPGLIYVAISPYGHYTLQAKELSRIPDSDLVAQAASGLPALIGELPDSPEPYNWPTRAGFWASWYISGVAAAMGALLALYYRQITGEGQMVDVATFDAFSACVGFPVTMGFVWGKPRPRYGPLDYGLCPYGFFKCKDGYVAIAAFRDQDFRAILKIFNRWDLEEDWRYLFDRITDDVSKAKELNREIENIVAMYTCDEIIRKFSEYARKSMRSKLSGGGLPVTAKMLTPKEVLKENHWYLRKTFVEVNDSKYGKFVVPICGKLSETPPRIKWVSATIGKDNEYVYRKYGLEK
ncbi:MAG: CoA transferase [Candidatus Korarchaeota archaeon]|nr:CoA transferase [Thermoproteota archaeon]